MDQLFSSTSITPFSQKLMLQITESVRFNFIMMTLTILNLFLIVFEMYSTQSHQVFFPRYSIRAIDAALLGVFTFEMGARWWAWRWVGVKHWWMWFGKFLSFSIFIMLIEKRV